MRIRQNIRKNFFRMIALQLALLGLLAIAAPSVHVAANPVSQHQLSFVAKTDILPGNLPDVKANKDNISKIMTIVFGIIGAFAVLNITLSGFKYITSAGDAQKTSEAKNGIVYSLIGLVIAITAEALVVFVVKRV